MTAHHPPLHKNNSTVSSSSQSSTNIVGVHYRVGKKLGEGSFGVLYEGISLLRRHINERQKADTN